MQSSLPQMNAKNKDVRTYCEIAAASGACAPTVIDTLKKYCREGLAAAIKPARNPNSDTARLKATGDVEAKIIARACMCPPEGYARWTVSLLTEQCAVILEESFSRTTIGRVMQRNEIRPHLNSYWCIPPKEDAEFVAHMEDILDVYQLIHPALYGVWMKSHIRSLGTAGSLFQCAREQLKRLIRSISETGRSVFSVFYSRIAEGSYIP